MVIIPLASPRYCVCWLRSQVGTTPGYLGGTAVPLCEDGGRRHCCWGRCAAVAPSSPAGFCTTSVHDSAGRGESCFLWCRPRCAATHQEAEQLQLLWPHPAEDTYFWKISTLPWRICVMLTCHLPSARQMRKISLSLPANGHVVSGVFVFCVNQQLGAGLFSSLETSVTVVTQGSPRLQSTRSCSKSGTSPQPGD